MKKALNIKKKRQTKEELLDLITDIEPSSPVEAEKKVVLQKHKIERVEEKKPEMLLKFR
jgi:hypothetical protein